MSNTIAFIGLGHMGKPMALNLLKAGHSLKVFDLNAEAMKELQEAGAQVGESAVDIAKDAQMVFTMLPAGRHVRQVYEGENGLLQAVAPGTVLVDCSTIDAQTSQDLAAKAAKGTPVKAADVVASMQRWTSKDSIGRAMTAISAAEWKTVDEKTFTLTLKEPFGMVLEGMAKPSGFPPVVMPERLAKMPTTTPLTEVLGSGPFVFKRDEWVPGNKVVFVRNPHYVPRNEPANGLAGGKKSAFDRIEWSYIPDANSAVAALKKGEVDLIEQVPPDYINPLRSDSNVKLAPSGAWQGWMVMNQLHPPFNNPKIRQAVLKAVSQDKFMAAMGYPVDMRVTNCATFFICGSAHETFAGAEPWRTPDLAKAKQMLAEAGYKGEKVVLLVPSMEPATMAVLSASRARPRRLGLPSSIRRARLATPIMVPVASNTSTSTSTRIT